LRWLFFCFVFCCTGIGFWVYASLTEIRTGHRLWPWSAYAFCGRTTPAALPATVRVGLYEEFSTPWRLAKLQQLTFPVTLAVAAASRTEFLQLRTTILTTYPQVREVYFWPVLSAEEGYYPGAWSSPEGIRHLTTEATDLPLLWDLEVPRGAQQPRDLSLRHWWTNRTTLAGFFARHEQPIHLWRTYASMRLNPAFLRLTALHFDPLEYPTLHLHLDLYTTGTGQDAAELARLARCGVERYGARFIPSLGVLNDGEGPERFLYRLPLWSAICESSEPLGSVKSGSLGSMVSILRIWRPSSLRCHSSRSLPRKPNTPKRLSEKPCIWDQKLGWSGAPARRHVESASHACARQQGCRTPYPF
jgi:hypothetical protein